MPTFLSPTIFYSQALPKFLSPLDFHEDQNISWVFFNSCSFYIYLALEQFSSKEEKVLWALIFFKKGQAAKWSKNVFKYKADTSVMPDSCLGNKSDIFYHNNKNNQLERQVWPPRDNY